MATVKGTFTIHVTGPVNPLAISPASGAFPDEVVGSPATGGVSISGGTPPYTATVTAGALPDGVTLDSATGTLSGTPTSAGDATLEITVTDSGV